MVECCYSCMTTGFFLLCSFFSQNGFLDIVGFFPWGQCRVHCLLNLGKKLFCLPDLAVAGVECIDMTYAVLLIFAVCFHLKSQIGILLHTYL